MNAGAEPLHIEPGLWEVVYTYTLHGPPPPAVLAGMPPEKRAAVQRAWAAHEGQPKTRTARVCVTADDIANGTEFENDHGVVREGCDRSVRTRTAARLTLLERCTSATGPSERSVELAANGPHAVHGAMNSTKSEPDAATGISMTFDGRWLARDCGNTAR